MIFKRTKLKVNLALDHELTKISKTIKDIKAVKAIKAIKANNKTVYQDQQS